MKEKAKYFYSIFLRDFGRRNANQFLRQAGGPSATLTYTEAMKLCDKVVAEGKTRRRYVPGRTDTVPCRGTFKFPVNH